MAYVDALQDRADIINIAYVKNAILEESKVETVVHSNIPCRLMKGGNIQKNKTEDYQELNNYNWLIQVQPQHNQGQRGDRVTIDTHTYIITRKQEVKGRTPAIHHVIYLLDEYDA